MSHSERMCRIASRTCLRRAPLPTPPLADVFAFAIVIHSHSLIHPTPPFPSWLELSSPNHEDHLPRLPTTPLRERLARRSPASASSMEQRDGSPVDDCGRDEINTVSPLQSRGTRTEQGGPAGKDRADRHLLAAAAQAGAAIAGNMQQALGAGCRISPSASRRRNRFPRHQAGAAPGSSSWATTPHSQRSKATTLSSRSTTPKNRPSPPAGRRHRRTTRSKRSGHGSIERRPVISCGRTAAGQTRASLHVLWPYIPPLRKHGSVACAGGHAHPTSCSTAESPAAGK